MAQTLDIIELFMARQLLLSLNMKAILFLFLTIFSAPTSTFGADCVDCQTNFIQPALNADWPEQVYEVIAKSIQPNPGFDSIDNPQIPSSIRESSKSIFQVVVISGKNGAKSAGVLNLNSEEGIATKRKLKEAIGHGDYDLVYKAQLAVIENCEKKGQAKCLFFTTFGRGSAFVAEKDNLLWTNDHVIDPFFQFMKLASKKTPNNIQDEQRAIGIFLFDKNGNMVFNGLEEKATIAYLAKETSLSKIVNKKIDNDYIALKLPRRLAEPLPISKSIMPQEEIYIAGYPTCSGCQEQGADSFEKISRGANKDSSGIGMFVSSGKVLKNDLGAGFLGPFAYTLSQSPYNLISSNSNIFTSADSVSGMSGSPILNKRGEVVAILASEKAREVSGEVVRMPIGVKPEPLFNP